MKVNIFKKLIRDIIREELDYKFSALEKKLDEVVVKSNVSNINEDRTQVPQSTDFKKLMNDSVSSNSNTSIKGGNVSSPKTKSSILNDLLEETAQSGEWKNIEREGTKIKSVQDNVEQLPEHLASALTKDYSQVMKKANEKSRMKNGA
tara:strand:+ start:170 stop:613 length:444 start_codon:yes stop_codon:yes gene_type:complete